MLILVSPWAGSGVIGYLSELKAAFVATVGVLWVVVEQTPPDTETAFPLA
jgi:hypothetical protein